MFDCANVEIRELLPALAAETVDASTRARVEAHLTECAECASELETLRLVRSAFGAGPAIDVRRIVAALPKAPAGHGVRRVSPVRRWIDWRIAAALTTITVGGLSLAVSRRAGAPDDESARDTVVAVQTAGPESTPAVTRTAVTSAAPSRDTGSLTHATSRAPTPRDPVAKAQLSFGGGMSDLDDAAIQQLLGALDEIDRAPVAPPAEPDRSPVLPVIRGSDQ